MHWWARRVWTNISDISMYSATFLINTQDLLSHRYTLQHVLSHPSTILDCVFNFLCMTSRLARNKHLRFL